MKPINVYLIARISPDAHSWNDAVCDSLDDRFEVFKPQEHNPFNTDHRDLQQDVFDVDLAAMERSQIGLVLPPYGRDCAWEVGWYAHSEKPVVAYVETNTGWLRDWMVKGGLDQVFTPKHWMFDLLRKDNILADKGRLISDRSELSNALAEVQHG